MTYLSEYEFIMLIVYNFVIQILGRQPSNEHRFLLGCISAIHQLAVK